MDWKLVATLPEKEQMRLWVENWKRLGPELERIKKEELRALTEGGAAADAESILSTPVDDWTREDRKVSSGFVEQQSIFAKWRAGE